MKKTAWKNRIKKACDSIGTYKPEFNDVIATLAGILEKRDAAEENYKKLGSQPIVAYTNKGGATNPVKNPALVVYEELEKLALNYWRDLGLTPKGLKALDESSLKPQKKNKLEELIESMSNEKL